MHICDTRLGSKLIELELIHLQQCDECNSQHIMLMELKQEANDMELMQPPEAVWNKLANSSIMNQKKKKDIWSYVVGFAASTTFLALTWLMFNNYQLQQQLEQVLQVNQNLELQLVQDTMPTFRQAQLLLSVRKIEQELVIAITPAEKLVLLKKRQRLIADMIKGQNGAQNEFSI